MNREQLERLKRMQQESSEVVIADIDQDGFLLSHFGPIENSPTIPKEQFLARHRREIKLVAVNGYVGVKKDYRGSKLRFVNEIEILHNLGLAGCNVPAIIDVDFDNLTLTVSYILGPVLREELAKRGAALRDRELRKSPDYLRLGRLERAHMRAQEGRRVLYEVVDSTFIEALFGELSRIHACGVIGNDIKYGNVIIEKRSRRPYWIDLEEPSYYGTLGKNSLRLLRDRDIENFNLFFGTEKLTYTRIRKRIESRDIPAIDDREMQVCFGSGLRIGSLWSLEVGYGCWHYILKHHLPPLSGKRILDLGGDSAFYAIQMLRQGARKIIGVEADSGCIAQANFVKAAFEWADNSRYNLTYIRASITDISTMDLGEFDLVTALSPRSYLECDCMPRMIQHLSKITGILVLQVNTRPDAKGKNAYPDKQVLLDHLVGAISNNGFPVTEVVGPRRHGHRLIIGCREPHSFVGQVVEPAWQSETS